MCHKAALLFRTRAPENMFFWAFSFSARGSLSRNCFWVFLHLCYVNLVLPAVILLMVCFRLKDLHDHVNRRILLAFELSSVTVL
jgi:hypothetical protein